MRICNAVLGVSAEGNPVIALQDSHGHKVSQAGQLNTATHLHLTLSVALSYKAVHTKGYFGYGPKLIVAAKSGPFVRCWF